MHYLTAKSLGYMSYLTWQSMAVAFLKQPSLSSDTKRQNLSNGRKNSWPHDKMFLTTMVVWMPYIFLLLYIYEGC